MFTIEVHKIVNQMISYLYLFGIWQNESHSRFRVWCSRVWYLLAYGYVAIAIALGSMTTDNENEVVFLAVLAIVAFVLELRLYLFLWRKDEIFGFIRKMGVHSIKDDEEYSHVNDKINNFMKFVSFYEITLFCSVVMMSSSALPFIVSERRLPVSYYFPFDWHGNTFNYVIAYAFVVYGLMLTCYIAITNTIVWYLMMSCGVKYLILGNEFRNIGSDCMKESVATLEDLFLLELIDLIKKHKELQE